CIVECGRKRSAGMKSLRVLKVSHGSVRVQNRECACNTRSGSCGKWVVHRERPLIHAQSRSQQRIEILRRDSAKCSQASARYSTSLGTEDICLREPWSITLNGDIQVVLQSQVDRVLQADA